jgi:hypothetical protein
VAGATGEAWLDPVSVTVTRLPDKRP